MDFQDILIDNILQQSKEHILLYLDSAALELIFWSEISFIVFSVRFHQLNH